jgi:hypothetical protein
MISMFWPLVPTTTSASTIEQHVNTQIYENVRLSFLIGCFYIVCVGGHVLDHPVGNKGISCSRNVRRSRPCLHGLLSGHKEVSHNNRRKCKGSAKREGTRVGVRVCRCALSPRSRLALISLSSHSHPTLIPLSYSHLALMLLSSHSRLTLVSLSSRSHLALIPLVSLSSRSRLTLIALSSRTRLALISLSSHFVALSSRSHLTLILSLTFISLTSHHGLLLYLLGVVWVMTQHRNTQFVGRR